MRHPSRLHPPIGFAHRGARAHAPENTIEAFDLALKLGATGLESDVFITKDAALVLDHDGEIGRFLFKTAFADIERADLPDHIPTLDELWAACGSDYDLSLDIKDPAAGPPVVEAAVTAGVASRTWLCHPDPSELSAWRAMSDEIRLVNSTRLGRLSGGPERHIAALSEARIDAINMPVGDWSGGLVTLAHRFDRYAFAWDAQNERLLKAALHMGVDAVYSDHVDVMMEVMASEV